jgi:hypothetical protein
LCYIYKEKRFKVNKLKIALFYTAWTDSSERLTKAAEESGIKLIPFIILKCFLREKQAAVKPALLASL